MPQTPHFQPRQELPAGLCPALGIEAAVSGVLSEVGVTRRGDNDDDASASGTAAIRLPTSAAWGRLETLVIDQ